MSLPQRMHKVAEAGYPGFEFGDWRAEDPVRILRRQLGLECVCIVGNVGVNPKGMGLCDPAERAGCLAEIRASAAAARRFETSRMVVLTGNRFDALPRERQHASVVEGLKRAHDIVAPHGITLLLEVINTLAHLALDASQVAAIAAGDDPLLQNLVEDSAMKRFPLLRGE